MKLSAWLELKGVKKGDFALSIGVTGGWVTSLCDGSGWPSREVAASIARVTEGAVTADDFLILDDRAEVGA